MVTGGDVIAIPGKSNAKVKSASNGIRYDSSVYGSVPPVIIGRTRASLKMIFAGNFRTHKTSAKKGGGKKGGKQTAYSGNYDWLLGYAPVVWVASVWRNKDDFFPAFVGSQTFTSSTFTITNNPGPLLGIISVIATVDVSTTFNDFGAPGSVTISGQQQRPLYPRGQSGNFGNIAPNGQDYAFYAPGIYSIGSGATPANITIDGGHGITVDSGHPVTVFYVYSPKSKPPLAQANLVFERELGNGNAFDFSGGSQYRILYPEFAGISANNLDLGTGNSAPNDNFEVQSLYAYGPNGDANPADAMMDVMLSGNPTQINGAFSGFNWNHGLGFGIQNSPQGLPQFPNVLEDPPNPEINPTIVRMQPFLSSPGVFSAYIDPDGVTCWLFEFFAGGFARYQMSSGTLLLQGNFFNDPSHSMDGREGTTNLAFTSPLRASNPGFGPRSMFWGMHNFSGTTSYYASSGRVLTKMHVGSGGSITDMGNGLLVTDLTLDFNPLLGGHPLRGSDLNYDSWVIAQSGANAYLVLADTFGNRIIVVDAVALTLVGVYDPNDNSVPMCKPFMDNNGTFWFPFIRPATAIPPLDNSCDLVSWNPTAGVTFPNLNVTIHNISTSTLGSAAGFQFGQFVPGLNAVMLGNCSGNFTGDMALISLSTFTRTAFVADDSKRFFDFTFDGTESAMHGSQNPQLALPGDTNDNTQVGGILNLFNPSNLGLNRSINITQIIKAASFPTPTHTFTGRGSSPIPTPFAALQYSPASRGALITFDFPASQESAYFVYPLF